jgi:hypothetical protein
MSEALVAPQVAVRLVIEPPPAVVEVAAAITTRPLRQGEVADFLGAVHAPNPASFGDLLDASLSLGT